MRKTRKIFFVLLLTLVTANLSVVSGETYSLAVESKSVKPESDENFKEPHSDSTGALVFRDGFKLKYGSKPFDYEDPTKEKNWLETLLDKLFNRNSDSLHNKSNDAFWIFFFKSLVYISLAYGLYIFIGALINNRGLRIFTKDTTKIQTDFDVESLESGYEKYEELVKKAIHEQNYRLAVRFHFLLVLHKLSSKEIIHFHKDKTNTDYLSEIKDKDLREAFRYVTYIYNHSWYGGHQMNEFEYHITANAFMETINLI